MVEEGSNSVEYILCGCNCGGMLPKYDKWGRERKFIQSHIWRGRKHKPESLQKISENRSGKYTGEKSYWFGKRIPEKVIMKQILTKKARYVKEKHPRYGVKLTDETKRKISVAHKKIDEKKAIRYKSGYRYLPISTHPNANKDGYVAEHVVIMVEYLRRPLQKGAHIHHKNKIKTDNRIENLQLVTASEHLTLHRQEYKLEIMNRTCDICGTNKTTLNRKKDNKGRYYVWMAWRTNPLDRSQIICNRCWHRVYDSMKKKNKVNYPTL